MFTRLEHTQEVVLKAPESLRDPTLCACFAEGGWLQLALHDLPLGTGLPANQNGAGSRAPPSSSSSVSPALLFGRGESSCAASQALPLFRISPGSQQCTEAVFCKFPEPAALPPLVAFPAHPEPRHSATTSWKPDLRASLPCAPS